MLGNINIIDFFISKLIVLPGLLIAITMHELAHGYSAYKLGDPTAKDAGRLTLNPLAHIDILGFVLLFIVGFGWAKPVPINPSFFKNRKKDTIIVSIAGPLTNFVLAIISSVILAVAYKLNAGMIVLLMIKLLIRYNIVLGFFNLLPFPPLDGSKIVASLLPIKYEIKFYEYERYLYLILIFLIVSDSIDKILGKWIIVSSQALSKLIFIIIS
ncbi:site-2 protease family protein [Brassicibacter mesophilus]|uniref:site-2 protease family protein n=1 Tax=Brassicibacter mesophilus TaxID=745119 RepID=UPI003D21A173